MSEDADIKIIRSYFSEISQEQEDQFNQIKELYTFWNDQINVISRKDIENLTVRHILHSLSIAKVFSFFKNSNVIDIGTGGGFPGIPLAVMFPDVHFTLIDSVAKKIKVASEVAESLKLKNVKTLQVNSKNLKGEYNFITGRAVTAFPAFYNSVKHLFKKSKDQKALIYLKGGEFNSEVSSFKNIEIYNIKDFFSEVFFDTKKIIILKRK